MFVEASILSCFYDFNGETGKNREFRAKAVLVREWHAMRHVSWTRFDDNIRLINLEGNDSRSFQFGFGKERYRLVCVKVSLKGERKGSYKRGRL